VQVHIAEHALDTCLLAQLVHLMAFLLPARCCGIFSVLRAKLQALIRIYDLKNDTVIHLREDRFQRFKPATIFEILGEVFLSLYDECLLAITFSLMSLTFEGSTELARRSLHYLA
jgi:hypothetical protein